MTFYLDELDEDDKHDDDKHEDDEHEVDALDDDVFDDNGLSHRFIDESFRNVGLGNGASTNFDKGCCNFLIILFVFFDETTISSIRNSNHKVY